MKSRVVFLVLCAALNASMANAKTFTERGDETGDGSTRVEACNEAKEAAIRSMKYFENQQFSKVTSSDMGSCDCSQEGDRYVTHTCQVGWKVVREGMF